MTTTSTSAGKFLLGSSSINSALLNPRLTEEDRDFIRASICSGRAASRGRGNYGYWLRVSDRLDQLLAWSDIKRVPGI